MWPISHLQSTIAQNLIERNERVLVAVSGGADSLALLHMLIQIKDRLQIDLVVVTMDHMTRPNSSADAHFVADFCLQYDVDCEVIRENVPLRARHIYNDGVELVARKVRYRHFARVARRLGVKKLLTAHHADDQAETILLHIVRGSGLNGLRGMQLCAPMPYVPDLEVIRPLLQISHAELVRYCAANELVPRYDHTNDDLTLSRNHIRHRVIPLLSELNPDVVSALGRLAHIATLEMDALDGYMRAFLEANVTVYSAYCRIPRRVMREKDDLHRIRLIQHALVCLDASDAASYDLLKKAARLAAQGNTGAIAEFMHGLKLTVSFDDVIVGDLSAWQQSEVSKYIQISSDFRHDCAMPCETVLPFGRVAIVAADSTGQKGDVLLLPADAEVVLRTRQPGDAFTTRYGNRRKLKTWLLESKVPVFVRDRLPVLVVDGQVMRVWLNQDRFAHFTYNNYNDKTLRPFHVFIRFS